MRLTSEQIRRIIARVRLEGGDKARVYVYGSRLDDQARGGNLDLLVETDEELRPMEKAGLKIHLEREMGIAVDILAVRRGAARTPFQRIAYAKAVALQDFAQ